MGAVGGPPSPAEPAWSAQRIEAALPLPLRTRFQQEHQRFLALWQARAQEARPPQVEVETAPAPNTARHKWGDLMDDWEL